MKKAMDPMSSLTHLCGGIASIVVTILFLIKGIRVDTAYSILVGVCVFGISATCLYFTSSIYHYYKASDSHPVKLFLRKLDHGMIYVFIAGSYTPFILNYLQGTKQIIFLVVIWSLACVGILLKIYWLNAPRILYTCFYLAMGWLIVLDLPGFMTMEQGCFILLASGGISYTIGAIIYIIKKPNWFHSFGFHEIFHVFIMIGTAFQFLAAYFFIL